MSGEDVTIAAELRVPAEPEYLSVCRLALGGVAQDLDITDDTLEDMKLVLSEMCANAMQHGYPDDQNGVLTITLSTSADRLLVEVEDAGAGLGEHPTEGVGFRLLDRLCTGYRIGAGHDDRGTRVSFWHELPA